PERFAAVKKQAAAKGASFCEKTYEAGTRKFVPAVTREPAAAAGKGWKWVNIWATWCGPCVGEMALLKRWSDALSREGLAVSFELLSIDETAAEPELAKWRAKPLAGPISWIKGEDEFGAFVEGLGGEKGS